MNLFSPVSLEDISSLQTRVVLKLRCGEMLQSILSFLLLCRCFFSVGHEAISSVIPVIGAEMEAEMRVLGESAER